MILLLKEIVDNLIKTDAGNDRVGIGISAPGELT